MRWTHTTINTFSDASRNLFQTLNFRNISGPNALQGIVTSSVTPSFGFSTIDSPIRPHRGRSFFLSTEVAGLGGNVKFYRPLASFHAMETALSPEHPGRALPGQLH